jgi:hypothetical protein
MIPEEMMNELDQDNSKRQFLQHSHLLIQTDTVKQILKSPVAAQRV